MNFLNNNNLQAIADDFAEAGETQINYFWITVTGILILQHLIN